MRKTLARRLDVIDQCIGDQRQIHMFLAGSLKTGQVLYFFALAANCGSNIRSGAVY
jgi:hypothetical protein